MSKKKFTQNWKKYLLIYLVTQVTRVLNSKRKLKFIEKFSGLPNCRHHVGAISNEQHIKLLNKKKEKKDEK